MPFRKVIVLLFGFLILSSFNRDVFADNSEHSISNTTVAGQYFLGDGLGVNNYLKLTENGNFSFKWHGCLGMYDENEGPYVIENGILVLSPQRPNIKKGFQGTPTRFLPIHWGDRLYLVPE